MLENSTKAISTAAAASYHSPSNTSLSAKILVQSCQSNTTICEKITLLCASILLLSIKSDNDDMKKSALISNHLAPAMRRTNDGSNDSRNADTTTAL